MPGEPLGPVMVRLPVIVGSVPANVTVPVTLNTMLSWPLPALQLLVAVLVFAAVIASRRLQVPAGPVGSAKVLTVIVAARAAMA